MTDESGSTDSQIAEIEATMRADYGAYQTNPGMQSRYLELLNTREAAPAREPSAVETEIAQIERRIQTDNRGYRGDPEAQARYLELLQEKEREGDAPAPAGPEHGHFKPPGPSGPALDLQTALGDPVEVLAEYRDGGRHLTAEVLARGGTHDLTTNVESINFTALNVVHDIADQDSGELFLESFNRLPDKAQAATFDALLTGAWDQPEATPAEISTFRAEDDAATTLLAEWGENAAFRLGVVKARTAKIFAGLSATEKREVEHFITSAPAAEWTAVLRQLGNPEPVHMRPAFKKMKGAA